MTLNRMVIAIDSMCPKTCSDRAYLKVKKWVKNLKISIFASDFSIGKWFAIECYSYLFISSPPALSTLLDAFVMKHMRRVSLFPGLPPAYAAQQEREYWLQIDKK